jgi:glycosyltransferase involved in cell wall biosynthesis
MHKLVSVLLPVFNGDKYLSEAIESILNQTYINFEFIIINDGSTDNTLTIIENYRVKDNRIVVISRENKGLVASLNEGIRIANGSYIARMDHDDISLPTRLEEQIKFMDSNQLDICGTYVQLFNKSKDLKVWEYPQIDNDIKFTLMSFSTFAHPSVVIRKEVFKSLKYEDYNYGEDYKLWTDIAKSDFKMGNLCRVLLRYRWHDQQISKKYSSEQENFTKLISKEYVDSVNIASEGNLNKMTFTIDIIKYLKLISLKNNISHKYVVLSINFRLKNLVSFNIFEYFVYLSLMSEFNLSYKDKLLMLVVSILPKDKNSLIYKASKLIKSKFLKYNM